MGFLARRPRAAGDGQRTLRVVAADAGADWRVTVPPDGAGAASVERGGARAGAPDVTVTGPASDLYLLLWNRSTAGDGGVSVAGDADLLKSWPERMHVTWS